MRVNLASFRVAGNSQLIWGYALDGYYLFTVHMSLSWTLVERYSCKDLLYVCMERIGCQLHSNAVVASVTKDFMSMREYWSSPRMPYSVTSIMYYPKIKQWAVNWLIEPYNLYVLILLQYIEQEVWPYFMSVDTVSREPVTQHVMYGEWKEYPPGEDHRLLIYHG